MGCFQSKQAADVIAPPRPKHRGALPHGDGSSRRAERVTFYRDDVTSDLVQHKTVDDIHTLFDFQDVIGEGHFGCVKRAVSKQSGKEWAVKVVQLTNQVDRDALRNEINILRRLHHPNIVRVLSSYEDRKGMYMVMQLCKGKELYEHVYKDRRVFTEDDVRRLMRSLLRAVAFLHSNSITHRDLKLENLLLEKADQPSSLKLCDFGLSTRFRKGEKLQKSLGTIDYVAPEVLDGEYNEKCDLWSVGVICYELLTGVSPFHAPTVDETMDKIFDGVLPFHDAAWRKHSPHSITFIKALVREDVDERFSALQALNHKWLRDLDAKETVNDERVRSNKRLLLTNMLNFSQCRKMKQTALLSVALGVSEDGIHQAMAAEVFHSMDVAKGGTITRDEFCDAMVECGITREDASELFGRINQSKSEQINFLEFMAAAMDQRDIGENTIKEAFGLLDREKSGRLSILGLQDVFKNSLVPAEVKEMIASADTKGDGFVDFQEFQDLFRHQNPVALETVVEGSDTQSSIVGDAQDSDRAPSLASPSVPHDESATTPEAVHVDLVKREAQEGSTTPSSAEVASSRTPTQPGLSEPSSSTKAT